MSRVITFSRVFPSYHPRAGEPTYFVEKILRGIHDDEHLEQLQINYETLRSLNFNDILELDSPGKFEPKHHTIRAGHRWKVGDWFSPRVWSGIPYKSKQITFAPDIEIKKVWDFLFLSTGIYRIGTRQFEGEVESDHELLEDIAKNDGLSKRDLLEWFQYPKYFDGQIIAWNENINY